MFYRTVRASRLERTKPLPGDDLIPQPIASLTHAITIHGSCGDVWPWLAQMGAGNRAGWYSYDFLDNGRRKSAEHIVPEWQRIGIGTLFPALPGATDGFVAVRFEPAQFLVLGWPAPDGSFLSTWVLTLEEEAPDRTRLITRARGAARYPYFGLPAWLGRPVVRLVHFLMQRKQLLGVARRVERDSAVTHALMPTRFTEIERAPVTSDRLVDNSVAGATSRPRASCAARDDDVARYAKGTVT